MKQGAVEISVVIATRNRADRLAEALDSLARQTLESERFEVIVTDDGSTDGTPELLAEELERRRFPLRVLRHETPAGPSRARNAAWRAAEAPLVAFTDDDCVADIRWLKAGLAAWACRPEVFVQGPTAPLERELDRMGLFSYTVDIRTQSSDFPTCNMFYPKALLDRLDGFDAETFPRVGEDTDLAWRAQGVGAEPVFAADALVEHAVVPLGPVGFLRRVWSWGDAMGLCVRHPGFRRERLFYRVFWNWQHYLLARLAIAFLLPWRMWSLPLKAWLGLPYIRYRLPHPRHQRASVASVVWFVLADAVAMAGTLRGALRAGTFVV